MPERRGGVSFEEIRAGFGALASVGSREGIPSLIESMPVLRTPMFHAQLRQFRLGNESEFRKVPGAYESFMGTYDAFFTRLHEVTNLEEAALEPSAPVAATARSCPLAPFWDSLRQALGASVLLPEGPTHDPSRGVAAIADELRPLTKARFDLRWEPSPGTRWCALVYACGRCREPAVAIRPYFLDVQAVPALLGGLGAGEYEWAPCAHCGATRVLPLRTWICEQPGPRDPLGCACTLVRVCDTEVILRPPPGSRRNPDNDRILEVRLDMLIRQFAIEQPAIHGTMLTNGVAYQLKELLWRIESTAGQTADDLAYEATVLDISTKVATGMLDWQTAEEAVHKSVELLGQAWPLRVFGLEGDLVQVLVRNLIAAACAEKREGPMPQRLYLAALVAKSYAALGETARARINLARVRDLAARLADGDDPDGMLGQSLREVEAEILRAEGRFGEAEARTGLESGPPSAEGDRSAQVRRAAHLQNEGLHLLRAARWGAALEALGTARDLLGGMATAGPLSADERHTQSGVLANLALVLWDCAYNLDLLEAGAAGTLDGSTFYPRLAAHLRRLGSAEGFMRMQVEMRDRVMPILHKEKMDTPSALRNRAASHLREAIALGTSITDIEYLVRQTNSLAALLRELGDAGGAVKAAEVCVHWAGRLRDHGRLGAASFLLAELARDRGEVEEAVKHLSRSLEAAMRETIRGAEIGGTVTTIGLEALKTAKESRGRAEAILIAESTKYISTVVSLVRAAPLTRKTPQALASLLQRREDLRLRAIWAPGEKVDQELAELEAALDRARKELALRDPSAAAWHEATYWTLSRAHEIRAILAKLGPRATLAGFLAGPGELFAYALWAESEMLVSVPLPDPSSPAGDVASVGAAAFEGLAPRISLLRPDDRLLVSPCPDLGGLALADVPFRGAPLCRQVAISIVHGTGMLEACAGRPFHALKKAVVVGAPARPELAALPDAAIEAGRIAAQLERGSVHVQPVLTGAAATIPAMIAGAAGAGLLHFGCHAFADPDGTNARLMLAPAPLARDSGVLSEDRIVQGLALQPGCHVNLAACRTAVTGAEGAYFVHGLVNAFLVTGASTVLATLWPLPDRAAAVFQEAYYGRLAAGSTPAVALSAAQRMAIDGELGADLRRPESYAGYVLYGVEPCGNPA